MRTGLIILPLLFLVGCMATQNDMLLLQSQIDDLNANLSTLQKNQADLALKIDNLNASLNATSENMKDLSSDINKLSAKIDEYNLLTDKKINTIGQEVKKQQEETQKATMPSKLYSSAVSMYSAKDYDNAIKAFGEYINKYPNADNTDNAYFYSAEIFYEQKNYRESAIFYGKLLESYPNHLKTPVIRLKYALSLLNLKDKDKKDEALRYLKSIIKDFPNSNEAKTAKEILNKENPKTVKSTSKTVNHKK
jgi:tol-pal system protein YbgF